MVPLSSLWLPILLSAAFVFILSSIIHMVLPYHKTDMRKLPAEEGVMDALSGFNLPPGDYVMPHAASSAEMKDPGYAQRLQRGPVAFITVMPSGTWSMGKPLAMWFAYCLVVSLVAAYVAGRALGPGAAYLDVFRFAGTTAFAGYVLALWQQTIWYRRALSTTLKSSFDGILFALVTGGVFGWLWP